MSRQSFLANKRNRVKGSGPSRNALPNYRFVTNIPQDVQSEVLSIIASDEKANDLYSTEYNVSNFCDLRRQVPQNHVNILLQKPKAGSDGMDQKDYIEWSRVIPGGPIQSFINKFFPNCYRARIAILPPQSEIDWHIDMSTKVSLRFHGLIKNPNFIFEVDRKKNVERIPFAEGEMFFTNTAYPHRAYNPTDTPRISLLVDVDYSDVTEILPVV